MIPDRFLYLFFYICFKLAIWILNELIVFVLTWFMFGVDFPLFCLYIGYWFPGWFLNDVYMMLIWFLYDYFMVFIRYLIDFYWSFIWFFIDALMISKWYLIEHGFCGITEFLLVHRIKLFVLIKGEYEVSSLHLLSYEFGLYPLVIALRYKWWN